VNPFTWAFGPLRPLEGQQLPGNANKQKRSTDTTPTSTSAMKMKPTQARTSANFHYPALPEQYWATHKKPEVPIVDVDNTKLEHIYGNKIN